MVTENELREKYQNEHIGNPYIDEELSFPTWKRLYIRLDRIEATLRASPRHPRYDELDRESSRLCGLLGY
jgi:hypothetical protein